MPLIICKKCQRAFKSYHIAIGYEHLEDRVRTKYQVKSTAHNYLLNTCCMLELYWVLVMQH